MLCRSVKLAELLINAGDIVELAPADSEETDGAEPPLALLQAIWQTKKGQCTACLPATACYLASLPAASLKLFAVATCDTRQTTHHFIGWAAKCYTHT